jgi:hypothetical protein
MPTTAQDQQSTWRSHPGPRADGLAPSPQISLHHLDSEAVLFDAATSRLYAVNAVATLIWSCRAAGLSDAATAAELSSCTGCAPAHAAAQVDDITQQWRGLGLLGHKAVAPMPAAARRAWPRAVSPTAEREAAADPACVLHARILDSAVTICLPAPSWCDRLQPLLAGLMTAGPPAASLATSAITLSLVAGEHGLAWQEEGGAATPCVAPNHVAPLLKATLVELALRRSHDLGAVHAAAIGRSGRCVLLPGSSGAGKSTLAAGLTAAGFEFLGDDTVVLDRSGPALRPVPFAICTKQGAWSVLETRVAGLRRQLVHVRPDRKRVRYLQLGNAPCAARYDVAAIVFPAWTAYASTQLSPLPRPQALQRLFAGFCALGDGLEAADVARLVAWIGRIDCFELRFSNLDDAIARLRPLLP